MRAFFPVLLVWLALLPLKLAAQTVAVEDSRANGVPYRLQAVDFATAARQIAEDPGALGGHSLKGTTRLILFDLPAPRTKRPVTVYARVRAQSADGQFVLETSTQGRRRRLGTVKPPSSGVWSWIRFPEVPGHLLGEHLRLDAVPSREDGRALALDSIVIATASDLSGTLLDQTPLLFPEYPIATVFNAPKPPRIDGRGMDPAWNAAVAIRDFLAFETAKPARLQTTARFLHDAGYLYVQVVAKEPLLRAADMRMDEIVARATRRDEVTPYDVVNDDACAILLQPQKGGPVYEFTANTIGTFLDARLKVSDLWKTRDVSWNSNARSVVTRKEGAWVWEMAVPLTDMGVKTPATGEVWNVSLARLAPSSKEGSAWNPMGRGAHRPRQWGQLRFQGEGGAVVPLAPLAQLQPGSNTFEVDIEAGNGAGRVLATCLHPDGGVSSLVQTFVPPQAGRQTAGHRFEVRQTASANARWGVFDAATMQPLYVSPEARLAVNAAALTLALSTPGPFEIVVNDAVVATGAEASQRKIKISLRNGANPIAIRAASGSATVSLAGDGMDRLPRLWRGKSEESPEATKSSYRDSEWPLVEAENGFSGDEAGKPLVLRRLVLSKHTQVWPVPEPALYIARNSVQPATFKFNGLPGRSLARWTTWIAVPEALEVLGVTGYYGARENQPVFHCERVKNADVEGKAVPLYKITADKPLPYDRVHSPAGRSGVFQLMLRVSKRAPEKSPPVKIDYWSEAEGGSVVELEDSLAVQPLAPLAGRQPRRFVFELWGSSFGAMDSEALRKETLATAKAAGFNRLVDGSPWTIATGPQYGIKAQVPITFKPWSIDLTSYLQAHPGEALLRNTGKRSPQWMCTTLLLGERWPVVSGVLADLLKKLKPEAVLYDYEIPPVTGAHACFCERCLAAFREEKKLGSEVPLNAEKIEAGYRGEWDDFMARRAALLLAKIKETVHAACPGSLLTVFSLPQSPRTVSVYGIDWRYVAEKKAADVAEIGTSGQWKAMLKSSETLGAMPIMYGVWIMPYTTGHMIPAAVATRAELLRRVLDSTRGILFFDRNTMDGRSWRNVGETSRLVADFEELFLNTRPQALPGQDPEAVQWLRGEKESLLCLMNQSGKPRRFSLRLPEGVSEGYEYYRKEKITGGEVHVTLPAHETAVYVFGEKANLSR